MQGSDAGRLLAALAADLEGLEREGLRRTRRVIDTAQGPRVRAGGRDLLAFCSNDYLGLANDPRIAAAAGRGIERHGVGAGASHLVSGHFACHHRLEELLAAFTGLPAALLFSTGYMANAGVVTALVGREDAVFADRLNHASLNDAAALSRATVRRYPHGDLATLERLLGETKARRRLVIVDGVFSMDGDIAPLPALLDLCERFDALLLVDDAHGFGVIGEHGRGTVSHFGLASPRIVYMGTLGKAAGVFGAFVAADPVIIDTLVNRARTYIYTTALPPPVAEALCESVIAIREADDRRARLRALIARLRTGLSAAGYRLPDSSTPIQPIIVGDNDAALGLAARLLERGILVPAIRPPTVPRGTARLRVALSAAHALEDVDALVAALSAGEAVA